MVKPRPARDRIVPTSLEEELRQSYLAYALSVMVGRALPDGRDGLKPVQRRILYAMWQMGLTAQRPPRKSARVVGEVLGKYHPHGDQSVYAALVRLAQEFHCRYPLIEGQGNFGSIDNDPAAAMRYTEARLSAFAVQILFTDLHPAIVDFHDNFDSTEAEPRVLPAQLPLLLLNGCSGIAVGMATQIPPHHAGEIIEALIHLIDYPHLSDERLYSLLPGPDFPTGGELVNPHTIPQVYRTGRGAITLRGVWHRETQGTGKRAKPVIVITELPYQVVKADWLSRTAALIHQGRLGGIADLRDESDRDGVRVVVTLKSGQEVAEIIQQLLQQTPLEIQFHASFLALIGGRPQHCSLRRLLQEFLEFRELTLQRSYAHEWREVTQQMTRLTALHQAITHLDIVFTILRHCQSIDQAKADLMQRLALTEDQAETVLSTPLRRLTRLEAEGLQTQLTQLTQRQSRLTQLQQDRGERLRELKKQLKQCQKQYGGSRKTRLGTTPLSEDVGVTLRLSAAGVWHRGERRPGQQLCLDLTAAASNLRDPILWQGELRPGERLLVFGERGGLYELTGREMAGGAPGWPDWFTWEAGLLPVVVDAETMGVWLVSRGGYGTVMGVPDLWQGAWGFPPGDGVLAVGTWQTGQELYLASGQGRVWRGKLPRRSHGKSLLVLAAGESLVGAVMVTRKTAVQGVTAGGECQDLPAMPLGEEVATGVAWVGLVAGLGIAYGHTNRQRWVRLGMDLALGEQVVRVVQVRMGGEF
ncbi:DNA topoisomerase IV subunit A [Gloeomargarita lithophora Alchichica-D10]|uniref:DNA topoisomerase IV subunit A n=1 Tax=Gloeomargarita lithophora Alchichica-D10 TaxID=1188229 RepID=A0A1J0ABZ7_9CYAN|nr:DNA gyrase subunit A [Gloeomargarita lithophora]APB33425.1 DNA topoisomerase IV subunit A [Gloeomargarita lithophora Alchichica-D10]